MRNLIVTSPRDFLHELAQPRPHRSPAPATMRAALLVTPVGFRISEESASDNLYMTRGRAVDPSRALAQHAELVSVLAAMSVPAIVFSGRDGMDDAVFPNNAFGTVPGRLIIGSMRHPVRRGETRREDVRAFFREISGREIVDLSRERCVAELTGPLVIDRRRHIGFCGMTERVDAAGCRAMARAFRLYTTFRFDLAPGEYHTNVVLAVLAGRACVMHPPSFADPEVPAALERAFPGSTVVLDDGEKAAYCGNCIAVTEKDVLFSARAMGALRPSTRARLEELGFRLHAVEIDEIEKAGGSVRCMIAEVF